MAPSPGPIKLVRAGRVRKNETLETSVRRLTADELGREASLNEMTFLVVYQHFYPDSMPDTSTSTHYVALAYHLRLPIAIEDLPQPQHSDYRWMLVDEIIPASNVHANTRAYLPPSRCLQRQQPFQHPWKNKEFLLC